MLGCRHMMRNHYLAFLKQGMDFSFIVSLVPWNPGPWEIEKCSPLGHPWGRHTSAVWKPSADSSLKQQGSNLNSLGCMCWSLDHRKEDEAVSPYMPLKLLIPSPPTLSELLFLWMMLRQWMHGINQWRHLLCQNAVIASRDLWCQWDTV